MAFALTGKNPFPLVMWFNSPEGRFSGSLKEDLVAHIGWDWKAEGWRETELMDKKEAKENTGRVGKGVY